MTKKEVLAYLKTRIHAVISTCGSDGQPESALVGFGETENLELILGTTKTSRKYKNLKNNNKVSYVISSEEDSITVQYQGIAIELGSDERGPYLEAYHKKVPGAAVFKNLPDQVYFKIIPTWIRYSDLSGSEPKVFEFAF